MLTSEKVCNEALTRYRHMTGKDHLDCQGHAIIEAIVKMVNIELENKQPIVPFSCQIKKECRNCKHWMKHTHSMSGSCHFTEFTRSFDNSVFYINVQDDTYCSHWEPK